MSSGSALVLQLIRAHFRRDDMAFAGAAAMLSRAAAPAIKPQIEEIIRRGYQGRGPSAPGGFDGDKYRRNTEPLKELKQSPIGPLQPLRRVSFEDRWRRQRGKGRRVRAPSFARFNAHEVFAAAADVLSRPPAKPHIVRVEGRGRLVRRFALPLELCPTSNATRHAPKGWGARIKENITAVMLQQTQGRVRMNPLPGRPMIIGIRFSKRQPDRYSNGFKLAIDRLMVGDHRLGYLRDDSPDHIDEHQRWELAPTGNGFSILEIWSGQ